MSDDHRVSQARAAARARSELEHLLDLRFGVGGSVIVGLAFAWAGIAIKAALNEGFNEETGYIVLMASAVLAGWFGGVIGGLTATLAAFLLNGFIFLQADTATVARYNDIRQVLYLVVSSGTVLLVASRRVSRDRLADALEEVASLADDVSARDERLELMLAASGTGFWEWEIASDRLELSGAISQQAGIDPAAPGPSFSEFLDRVAPEDRPRLRASLDAALEAADPLAIDVRFVWADASVHWSHLAGRAFRDADGRAIRVLGTGQDITERRRLEDERAALLEEERRARTFREAFIDVISHELRTPITTILGLTQILTRPGRKDDPEARLAMLEDVRAESERLHRLVEDLLVLSRMERGRLVADHEPLALTRLLRRVVEHEAGGLPTIETTLRTEPGLPVVLGEATYVEQILRNLLGNAAKYAPSGSHVEVEARRRDGEVAVIVRDDGPGIPERSRAHLFDLFYRDPDSERMVAGSGIGLFVCASLVEAMGGRIWVDDAPGGGAEFCFTLHVAEADDLDEPPGAPLADGGQAVRQGNAVSEADALSPAAGRGG